MLQLVPSFAAGARSNNAYVSYCISIAEYCYPFSPYFHPTPPSVAGYIHIHEHKNVETQNEWRSPLLAGTDWTAGQRRSIVRLYPCPAAVLVREREKGEYRDDQRHVTCILRYYGDSVQKRTITGQYILLGRLGEKKNCTRREKRNTRGGRDKRDGHSSAAPHPPHPHSCCVSRCFVFLV